MEAREVAGGAKVSQMTIRAISSHGYYYLLVRDIPEIKCRIFRI